MSDEVKTVPQKEQLRLICLGLSVVMVVGYVLFMGSTFLDFPWGDDFFMLVQMGETTVQKGWGALNWSDLSATFFVHRSVMIRFFGALQVLLFGALDFGALRMMGLVCIAVFFLIFCLMMSRRPGYPVCFLILLGLLFLQPQTYGTFLMAIQGPLQVMMITFVLAFALRSRGTPWSWVCAWLCAVVTTLGAGNGLLVPLLLVVWDVWERQWRWALAGSAIFALVLLTYFSGYEAQTHEKHAFVVADVIPGALVMVGGVFKFGWAPLWVQLVGGVGLVLSAAWSGWLAYRRRDGFLLACLLFVLGSVGMAAVGRAGWGLEYMLQPRYVLWGLLLLLFSLAGLAPLIARSRAASAVVSLAVVVFAVLAWWFYAPQAISAQRFLEASALSCQLGQPAIQGWSKVQVERGLRGIKKVLDLGVYRLPMKETAAELAAAAAQELEPGQVRFKYSARLAGYLATVPSDTAGRYLLFRQSGVPGTRVAALLVSAPSARALLSGGWRPKQDVYFLPRTDASTELPEGTFYRVAL